AAPDIPLRAEEAVHWFFRVPGEPWTLIEPGDALKRIDRHGGFARLDLAELKLASKVNEVHFACSMAGEQPPGQHAARMAEESSPPDADAAGRRRCAPDEPVYITEEGYRPEPPPPPRRVEVTMSRTRVPNTSDEILWIVIRNSANS